MKHTTGQASPETKVPEAAKPGQKASESKADIKKDKDAQAPGPAAKSTGQAQIPDSSSKATAGQVSAQDKDVKPKGASPETKSQGKTSSDMKADAKRPDKTSETAGHAKTETTGQGAAASLSTEQRTTIRTVIKQQNAKPMTSVNFSISVGTRVPRSLHFYPVPMELVQINPRWRGYDYFLVGEQIIVVNPRTHEIVAVLDA